MRCARFVRIQKWTSERIRIISHTSFRHSSASSRKKVAGQTNTDILAAFYFEIPLPVFFQRKIKICFDFINYTAVSFPFLILIKHVAVFAALAVSTAAMPRIPNILQKSSPRFFLFSYTVGALKLMRLIAAHAKFVIPAARNAAVYLRFSKPLADNSAFQPAACPHLTRSSATFKQRFTLFQPFIKGSEEISHRTAYCQNISHRLGRKYCVDLILCKQRRKNINKGYKQNYFAQYSQNSEQPACSKAIKSAGMPSARP